MVGMHTFWRVLCMGGALVILTVPAVAQSAPPIGVSSFPTGLRPLGIDFTYIPLSGIEGGLRASRAVVANSGDNSVSIFGLTGAPPIATLTPITVMTGVPSPYDVAACPQPFSGGTVLVTSPSDNSVRVLAISGGGGALSGRIQTGLQPFSVSCFSVNLGVVSNVGESTLTVLDPAKLAINATIWGIPGSRGFHGIAVSEGANGLAAWVAGTDANVVTVVDLANFRVLTQIPLSRPTTVLTSGSIVYVASAADNSITGYDRNTFRAVQFQSVPNPQDFLFSLLGSFAISGQDSLWKFDFTSLPGTASPVASIPAAAALAAPFYSPGIGRADCCALVLATSTSTNRVYLVQQAPGPPIQFGVSNGASFATGTVAPGSLASVFVATGLSQEFKAQSVPLPTTLGGVMLSIGGSLNFDTASSRWVYSSTGSTQAPLLFVGPNQINFQVPTGIALGDSVPAQLTKPDGTALTRVTITAAAPGIFSLSQDGRFQGAVLNDDYSQNGIPQLVAGARPAARGSMIQIFATGAGETNPPLLPGEPAPASGNPLVLTRVQPTVTIGGQSARVLFSGMAPGWVGLWQINAEVPQSVTPGPSVPLVISAGGISSNTVTIAVE